MIIVPEENHFIALTYDSEKPGEATVCLYTVHGHGIVEVNPVPHGDGVLTVTVDDEGKDKVELLKALKARLSSAIAAFDILNAASNARLFRPEDFQGGDDG